MSTISDNFIAVKPRRHRRRADVSPSAPPALMLIGANFHVTSGGFVNLIFDRAVDISHVNPLAVQVSDGAFGNTLYQGNVASLLSPTLVKVTLTAIGSVPAGNDVLNASAGSGIVAVGDGGTWAGASGVVLPFTG